MTRILDSLDAPQPPADLAPAERALWWLKKGGLVTGPEWERAHEICQAREGARDHDLVHGLAHLIEGDAGNARYWYRRADWEAEEGDLATEWRRIADALG